MDRFGWSDIELIKIDAEGEENNIVKGGRRFFADLAPLVQYELRKDATNMNFGLIREFGALGYNSYRLVPGLNLLIPFDAGAQPDPYLLNLFCCRADRADRLAAQGLLLRASEMSGTEAFVDINAIRSDITARYHWRHALLHLPYATSLSSVWGETEEAGNSNVVIQALSLYARSLDGTLPLVDRFRALEGSFFALKAVCEREPTRLRLASLARVAHDHGERAASVIALKQLLTYIHHAGVDPREPFLAPLERFESIPIDKDPIPWLVAGVLEQLEQRESFSSFYAGPAARERLEDIRQFGLGSAEMKRRLELVCKRFNHLFQQENG
jgi:hypothetical protein